VASGDSGAFSTSSTSSPSTCDGTFYYSAGFPATSAYVTAVGATFGPESGDPEVACDSYKGGIITSGGGFSYLTNRPSWQTKAVGSYLSLEPFDQSSLLFYNSGFFNTDGRGIPDVSLLGFNYDIIVGGVHESVSGTSASTPAFAAMVSLVNAARFAAGYGPIGFLNQMLYTDSVTFIRDITSGDSSCQASDGYSLPVCCGNDGWKASSGWDPITGLGSVDFQAFIDIFGMIGHACNKYH
jgi:tripeptidyl-peptidase-1